MYVEAKKCTNFRGKSYENWRNKILALDPKHDDKTYEYQSHGTMYITQCIIHIYIAYTYMTHTIMYCIM